MNLKLSRPINEQESIFLLKFAKEAVDRVMDKDCAVATKREVQNAFYASVALSFSNLKELKDLKELAGEE
jgi:hypothetical protein